MLTSLINVLEELNTQFNDFKTPADVYGHPLSNYDLDQIEAHEEVLDSLISDMEDFKEKLEEIESQSDKYGNALEDYDLDKMDENADAIERTDNRLDEIEARLDTIEDEIPMDSKALESTLELEKRLARAEYALRNIRGAFLMLSDCIKYVLDGNADDCILNENVEDDCDCDCDEEAVRRVATECNKHSDNV